MKRGVNERSINSLFNVSDESVSDLKSLSGLLHKLENEPIMHHYQEFISRGETDNMPRNKDTFAAAPCQWCMIDIDSLTWNVDDDDQ